MQKKVIKNKEISAKLGLQEKVKKTPVASKVDFLPNEGGVLNKKSIAAKKEAEAIVTRAQKESEKIRKEAEELLTQVNAELEKSKKVGYEEGHEEGLQTVAEKVIAFEKMKEEFYNEAEEKIIKLVMMISEKVIGKIVQDSKEAIKSVVRQALESALGERILIRLSPEDYKIIKSAESEFSEMLDRTKRINFKEDESISQGGCLVETEVGTIDARLETQLEAIRKALEL